MSSTTAHRHNPNRRTFVEFLADASNWIPSWFPAFCKIGTVVACTATISLIFGYQQGQRHERERQALIESVEAAKPISRGFYLVSEVAEREAVSERTVQLWCQQGRLPAEKVGKFWRIPIDYEIAASTEG